MLQTINIPVVFRNIRMQSQIREYVSVSGNMRSYFFPDRDWEDTLAKCYT